MSVSVAGAERAMAAHPGGGGAMSAADLAEILSRFSAASEALQRTHETLQDEVVRLTRELAEANEALQRSRRLAALGEMAAGIAHEVRNPLASIALDARTLEAELSERPEGRSAAARIGAAVRGLDQVVGDVLCFAREVRPRAARADAGEILERASEECGPAARASGVVVERVCGPCVIYCDAELAHRALTNLVRNAVEAIAERDGDGERRVCLYASAGAFRGESGGRRGAVLGVRDTGPGIGRGVIDRMFNPFFTTRAAGTGLGLAIVHRIMDAHGGRVEAWNNAGQDGPGGVAPGGAGATFELVFPEPGGRPTGRRVPMEASR